MSEIKILKEEPLTFPEVKAILEKREGTRIKKTKDYINRFTKLTTKQVQELKDKINKLGITRLKDKTTAKIIDLQPKDSDSLKMILSQENLTVKQEDLQKILECLK